MVKARFETAIAVVKARFEPSIAVVRARVLTAQWLMDDGCWALEAGICLLTICWARGGRDLFAKSADCERLW